MYPYLRLIALFLRRPRPLDIEGESVLRLRVLPWDADVYPEMNNGRQLTVMDLGRFDLARRTGLIATAKREGWLFVVGGLSVRYRRRLRPWRRFALRTRVLGRDRHWFYFHQIAEHKGELCTGALVRAGLCTRTGMVPTDQVAAAMGRPDWAPPLPDWVQAWIDADARRPEAARPASP